MAEKLNNLYGGFFKKNSIFEGRNWLVYLNVFMDALMVGILVWGLLGKEFTISSLGAILATFGVIFLAYGSTMAFPFNMAQNVTWFITAITLGFYADVPMAIFYFVSQIFGWLRWKKKRKNNTLVVERWTIKSVVVFFLLLAVMTVVVAYGSDYFGGNQVWLDSVNNSTAIASQAFQMGGLPIGNWGWLVTDVLQFIQYGKAVQIGEAIAWGAFLQTILQTINAVRSIINWHYMPKSEIEEEKVIDIDLENA